MEILVTLVVAAILSTIGMSSYFSWQQKSEWQLGLQQWENLINSAQQESRSLGQVVSLELKNNFTWEKTTHSPDGTAAEKETELFYWPDSFSFQSTENSLTWNPPYGELEFSAEILISDPRRSVTFQLVTPSGLGFWEKSF